MLSEQIILIKNTFSFLMGCCFGSFINVVIYRLPLGKSLIFPRSYCIECKYRIRWFENIPLLSWLFLRGMCRNCNKPISIIYPLVELTSGLLFLLNNYSFSSGLLSSSYFIINIFGWIFLSLLLVLSILDIKYFWLPDSICKIGILAGIFSKLIIGIIYEVSTTVLLTMVFESVAAAFLGYMIFQLISAIGLRIFQKPAMGKGDSKLAALIGSWLGFIGLGISTWLAFNLAGIFVVIGLVTRKLKRNQKIPFGTFLAFSAILVWHFGNDTFIKLISLAS
ncbi:prepilin peptidase [Prochlorococcus sp. MIT 1307]|uniref:prepilin peptidase n=1 Tax=Prochlorococcus sp. MIT 1307 TaxID=3096219 RepID=UPI002A74F05C|nr:prepilin peptidase [Prochlorococcus sp. MIT 1307]